MYPQECSIVSELKYLSQGGFLPVLDEFFECNDILFRSIFESFSIYLSCY
jgi:hypothetical protein